MKVMLVKDKVARNFSEGGDYGIFGLFLVIPRIILIMEVS